MVHRTSMSVGEYQLMRELVREQIGHVLAEDGLRQLERRLEPRLAELSLNNYAEYHRYVRCGAHEDELQRLFEVVTNNETYFFREDDQFAAFRDELLPRMLKESRRKNLSVWSVGCSTGEEAYSIAAILLDSPSTSGWSLHVYGTDISRQSLAVARRAIYGESSFRATSTQRRDRLCVREAEGFRVRDEVRRLCHFAYGNVMNLRNQSTISHVNAIFCRNVLIYFDKELRRLAIDGIYERLRSGGYLLLGHSESLLNQSTGFEVVQLSRDVVYRKPNLPSAIDTPMAQ